MARVDPDTIKVEGSLIDPDSVKVEVDGDVMKVSCEMSQASVEVSTDDCLRPMTEEEMQEDLGISALTGMIQDLKEDLNDLEHQNAFEKTLLLKESLPPERSLKEPMPPGWKLQSEYWEAEGDGRHDINYVFLHESSGRFLLCNYTDMSAFSYEDRGEAEPGDCVSWYEVEPVVTATDIWRPVEVKSEDREIRLELEEGANYVHYKNKRTYKFLGFAKWSGNTYEDIAGRLVCYRDIISNEFYVRPYQEFAGKVEDGSHRFTRTDEPVYEVSVVRSTLVIPNLNKD